MDRQNRLIWADSLKGCLMYLVIVGHIIQGMLFEECENNHLWNLIYSFHMPAFMAVSGWFVYKDHTQYGGVKRNFGILFNEDVSNYYYLISCGD